MDANIRESASAGLRGKLTEPQRKDLFSLTQMPGYEVLLDMMELECLKQETLLVNADSDNHAAIIAEHAKSQAMWQFFVRLQKQIKFEVTEGLGQMPLPESSDPDSDIPGILDATR